MTWLTKFSFYGIGDHSEMQFAPKLTDKQKKLFYSSKMYFTDIQNDYQKYMDENPNSKYYTFLDPVSSIPRGMEIDFFYYPFDGHVNRLGHYYRNLFHTVKYVANQSFDKEEKYEYIKMIRAQLSNFEQLMLYYNALAWFDADWKVYFTDYRLIKNLPLPLADFHKKPEDHFRKDIERLNAEDVKMFELHE
jgi:hypothetical protein